MSITDKKNGMMNIKNLLFSHYSKAKLHDVNRLESTCKLILSQISVFDSLLLYSKTSHNSSRFSILEPCAHCAFMWSCCIISPLSLNNLEKFPLPFDHPIRVYVNRVGDIDRVIQNSKFISGPRSILK